jgi:hypothetical protein
MMVKATRRLDINEILREADAVLVELDSLETKLIKVKEEELCQPGPQRSSSQ